MKVYRMRTWTLLLVAYAAVVYTVAELVHASRGVMWDRLERHVDTVDDRLTECEDASRKLGDTRFVERVGAASDRYTDVVFAATSRMRGWER